MTGKQWWWIGLTDERKPKGQQAVGAIIVAADDADDADDQAKTAVRQLVGTSDHLLFTGEPMDPKYGPPPPEYPPNMYLAREAAEKAAALWCGGVASPEQIKAAFLDDEAKVGEPLFKGKP